MSNRLEAGHKHFPFSNLRPEAAGLTQPKQVDAFKQLAQKSSVSEQRVHLYDTELRNVGTISLHFVSFCSVHPSARFEHF